MAVGGATSLRYYVTDHLGSVAIVLDGLGAVTERRGFDARGRSRNTNGTDDPAGAIDLGHGLPTRGFTGHEHIPSVGLVNMNARMFDPELARFNRADSIVGSVYDSQALNRYSYVTNRCLSATDPTGHVPCLGGAAAGALWAAGFNLAAQGLALYLGQTESIDLIDFGLAVANGALFGCFVTLNPLVVPGMLTQIALGGSLSTIQSVSSDLLHNRPVSPGDAILNGVFGAAGAGVGARTGKAGLGIFGDVVGNATGGAISEFGPTSARNWWDATVQTFRDLVDLIGENLDNLSRPPNPPAPGGLGGTVTAGGGGIGPGVSGGTDIRFTLDLVPMPRGSGSLAPSGGTPDQGEWTVWTGHWEGDKFRVEGQGETCNGPCAGVPIVDDSVLIRSAFGGSGFGWAFGGSNFGWTFTGGGGGGKVTEHAKLKLH